MTYPANLLQPVQSNTSSSAKYDSFQSPHKGQLCFVSRLYIGLITSQKLGAHQTVKCQGLLRITNACLGDHPTDCAPKPDKVVGAQRIYRRINYCHFVE